MCHDDPFKDEQCMKKETLGTNTFVWLRKCKGAKVCVQLPYYGEIIGACSIKVRSHYDGEVCANGNKCTSGICDGTKCKGLNPNIKCIPGLGQCQKGYLCRATANTAGSNNPIFKCQEPLSSGVVCEGFSQSKLTQDNSPFMINDPSYFDPSNNPCGLEYVCSKTDSVSTETCVKIGSVGDGKTASNPLACEHGYLDGSNKCRSSPSSSDINLKTSRGGTFTLLTNITKNFDECKKEWDKKSIKEEDAMYEAYRYTKNKKKINELFFKYTHTSFVGDADECALDYLWKQSSSNSLKFSLMILVVALLF